jgi:hypothetical protein
MQALLDDLVDFNRSNLGMGLKVVPSVVDLAGPAADEVEQLRGAHPKRVIELVMRGDLRGRWDARRMQQALRNLVVNALRYGAADGPVGVSLRGEEAQVTIAVTNRGPRIVAATVSEMFQPLKRGREDEREGPDGLGLGLYIVREIARAHGGEVEVRSSDEATVFTVRLPRKMSEAENQG